VRRWELRRGDIFPVRVRVGVLVVERVHASAHGLVCPGVVNP